MTLVNFGDKKKKALEEMKRVIKKDGKIIISVYSEKALKERLAAYELVSAKIKSEVDGFVTFDIDGLVSEQFNMDKIRRIADDIGLDLVNVEEVEGLAYIFTLVNK